MLLRKKEESPDEELVVFKSDISDAYRNLPMHTLWQIKQSKNSITLIAETVLVGKDLDCYSFHSMCW